MKKVFSFVLTLVLLVTVLAGCGTTPAPAASSAAPTPVASSAPSKEAQPSPKPQEDQIVLRLAENQPADYPTTLGDLEFARLVEERTNGRIKIEVYYGAQLGDEKSVIEQVQFGAIDFARISISYFRICKRFECSSASIYIEMQTICGKYLVDRSAMNF